MSRWSTGSILVTVGLIVLSLAASLLAAEAVVRLVRPQARLVITPGGLYIPDPPGGFRLAPGYRGRIYNRAEYDNEIRINSDGLRGEEVARKAGDVTRLLSIGDSFAFGVGVEDSETFTARVCGRLAELGIAAEGLNAGTPAFGVPDAVGWLSRHGLDLEPDVVILAVFLGNDLVDASPDREEIFIVDGLLVPSESAGGLKAWLHRHSHFYVLVKSVLEQPALLPLRRRLGLGEPWKVRTLKEEFAVYRKTAHHELEPAIRATDKALAELKALASGQSFATIGVLIPSEVQVDPVRWQGGLASLALDPNQYDPEAPNRVFSNLLARHGIPTLDLTPLFAEGVASGRDLYFRLDRHWTAQGHALAADSIVTFLRQQLDRTGLPEGPMPPPSNTSPSPDCPGGR